MLGMITVTSIKTFRLISGPKSLKLTSMYLGGILAFHFYAEDEALPGNVDLVILDAVHYFAGQVEDGVLVRFD